MARAAPVLAGTETTARPLPDPEPLTVAQRLDDEVQLQPLGAVTSTNFEPAALVKLSEIADTE